MSVKKMEGAGKSATHPTNINMRLKKDDVFEVVDADAVGE